MSAHDTSGTIAEPGLNRRDLVAAMTVGAAATSAIGTTALALSLIHI